MTTTIDMEVDTDIEVMSTTHQNFAKITVMNDEYLLVRILKFLDNRNLKQAMGVCRLWRKVAKWIFHRNRILFDVKILPRWLMRMIAFVSPSCLFHYVKEEEESRNFIVGFDSSWNVDCHICNKKLHDPLKFGINKLYKKSEEDFDMDLFYVWIAFFPSFPGVNMNRFTFSSVEIQEMMEPSKTNFSKLTKIPDEETKCVLWFLSGKIDHRLLNVTPKCALAGLANLEDVKKRHEDYRCIVFSGRRLKAMSIKLPRSKDALRRIFPTLGHFVAYKSIAFYFSQNSVNDDAENKGALSLFTEMYPNVPILPFNNECFFGVKHIPPFEENQLTIRESSFRKDTYLFAVLILLWFR
ncbi:uncharacterized protein LOC111616193 [Centruroides sculpturatus]|uniref:uncharacterized protein LOC111616193 n=1 Tax=Centruroides sculpturatus TaxID=218467 RepID=UPI000C6D429F|nr:uncharacterized protein LOC111616193 [Centruroides sculpturatus]